MSTINLLPDDYLKQRVRRRADTVCLSLFVVVVASVIGAYVVTERSRGHTLVVRDRVNAQYQEATKLIEQMQTLEAQKALMMRKAEQTASLVERVPRSTILAILTNARPSGTSLTDVKLTTRRPQLRDTGRSKGKRSRGKSKFSTKPREDEVRKPAFVEIDVTGLAVTDTAVARFMSNLIGNPMVESVDLDFSRETTVDDATVRQFKIKLRLKNDVDALQLAKRRDLKGLFSSVLGQKGPS